MMKFSFAILLILIFSVVSIFGFAMTSHGSFHICPAEQIQGRQCLFTDPFAVLLFHVGAFNNFITGIFGALVWTALLSLVAVFILNRAPKLVAIRIFVQPGQLREFNLVSVLFARQFLRWLSLRENSPSFL